MELLYLVRHAKAGERRAWTGDDMERPLSKKGWKQSELVGKRLAGCRPAELRSSPYVRCIQTLEPLGDRVGLEIDIDQRLSEDEPVGPVLDFLAEAAEGTVLCSHGDIIPAVIEALKARGTTITSPTDWRKASVWVLKRNRKGFIVKAAVWPPPVL